MDNNLIVVMTRNALATSTNVVPQAQLWQGAGYTCDAIKLNGSVPFSYSVGVTFGNMSSLSNPFLAELPSGYSTGLIRQFIPRINSTAQYQEISASQYPS